MRISGQVIGALATTATRRSVIFRSDGRELVFVFCTAPSSVSSAQKAAPSPAASDPPADRRKPRRGVNVVVVLFMLAILRDILKRMLDVRCWMLVKTGSGANQPTSKIQHPTSVCRRKT